MIKRYDYDSIDESFGAALEKIPELITT